MRQFNQPTAPEVAAILPEGELPNLRDIVMETYQGELKHISELHGAYDPLQYPLLFPHGEFGWTDDILRANEVESRSESQIGSQAGSIMMIDIDEEGRESRHTGATQLMEDLEIRSSSSFSMIESSKSKDKGKGKQKEVESDNNDDESEIVSGDEDLDLLEIQQEINKRKRVTIREFIVYRLQIRDSNKTRSILHLSGRLFQQYLVDQYAKWESNRLRWYKLNQQKFRTEIFSGLQDVVSNEDFSYN